MGGLSSGEVASRLALDALTADFATDRTAEGLVHACRQANLAVLRRADRESVTMGTTLVAVAETTDAGVVAAHVGDSRLYRLRDGNLDALTRDHTVIAELVRAGAVSEDVAEEHPHRNVLTRAVGVRPDLEVDTFELACRPGDRLLLCSDGLFKTLTTEEIEEVLASEPKPAGRRGPARRGRGRAAGRRQRQRRRGQRRVGPFRARRGACPDTV